MLKIFREFLTHFSNGMESLLVNHRELKMKELYA